MRQFYKIKKLRLSEADKDKNLQFLFLLLFFNYIKSVFKTRTNPVLTTNLFNHDCNHDRNFTLAIYG